jgi:hypothetical protein
MILALQALKKEYEEEKAHQQAKEKATLAPSEARKNRLKNL